MQANEARLLLKTLGMDRRTLDRHLNAVDPIRYLPPEVRAAVADMRKLSIQDQPHRKGVTLGKPRNLLRAVKSRLIDPQPERSQQRTYSKPR